MNGQRKLAVKISRLLVETNLLDPPGGAPKTRRQRDLFIRVPQRAQQLSHLVGALPRGTNDPQRLRRRSAALLHALEQDALELPAITGSIRINPAAAPVKSRAGLRQFLSFPLRAPPAVLFQRQARRQQSRRVIPRLQPDVGENHSIAAQAARQANFSRCGNSAIF